MSKKLPYNKDEIELFSSINQEIEKMADQKLLTEAKHRHPHGHHTEDQKKALVKKCEKDFFNTLEKDFEKLQSICELFYAQLKIDDIHLFHVIEKKVEGISERVAACHSLRDLEECNQHLLSEDILKKLYERGVSAFQADHAEIALLYFTFLSMVDAKNSQIWLMKGMSAQNSGHYDEALAAYNMAISLDPNFLAAYIQTINCLILANHLDAARAAYELFMHEVDPQEYIHNPYIIEKLDTIKNCLHQTV